MRGFTMSHELSHIEMCSMVSATLGSLTKEDPLLSDLPENVTVEEVKELIAVEHGHSITLFLDREALETVKLVIVNNSTIEDLKTSIERQVARFLERQGKCTTHLSWRYFWRKHWIIHNGQKLIDNKKTINQYGIRNKDHLTFTKRLKGDTYHYG